MSQVLQSFTRPSKWNWSGQPEPNKSQNQLYFVWWEWTPIFQSWFWFDGEGDNDAPVDDDDNEIKAFHLPLHFRFNCFLFNSSKETKRVEANMMLIKTMLTRDIKWGTIAMSIVFFLRFELCHFIFFCIFYFGFVCCASVEELVCSHWQVIEEGEKPHSGLSLLPEPWRLYLIFLLLFSWPFFYQIIRLSR